MHPNIEKSAIRRGEYVGHCQGAQRIRRGGKGWITYALGSSAGTFVSASAETLYQLGGLLAYIQANDPIPNSKHPKLKPMKTIPILQIIEDVADSLRGYRLDVPMIRQAINDHIDSLEKSGHRVSDRWSQRLAVRRVARLMSRKG